MPGTGIFTVGELLAEFVSQTPDCRHARPGSYRGPFPSGAPAIFLDQAARCGAATAIFGAVGDDGFGQVITGRLEANGVDCGGVTVDDERPTGVAFVSYRSSGARDFIFYMAGSAATRFEAPATSALGAGRVMHVSGSSLGNPALRDIVADTAERHLSAGGELSLDPNVRKELFEHPDTRRALERLVARATYLLPSLEDLDVLFPERSVDAAIEAMLESGARVVAVKRGASGAIVARGDERVDLDGHSVETVDPTGAGDCFCGTLVSQIVQDVPLELAARRANAAGAMSVRYVGPMEGNRDLAEIDAYLEREREAQT